MRQNKVKNESELERKYQSELIKKLSGKYGKWNVNKMPPTIYQGVPDVEVTCGCKFARLECKAYENAEHQPNQDYHVQRTNEDGAFARFIYPENEDIVLKQMEEYFNK